eukprot:TRINITY_DN27832_c0_g7_i1.p1 TRINITY_DN27832_c0_g7~~TRINITY_DN27832_c0_g7_i1.p1  ORF type:complete len:580 (-),score=60.04 TRINITY_DN27832_c0_g7_i1:40-1779(-)
MASSAADPPCQCDELVKLRAEVDALREQPPSYVLHVGPLREPSLLAADDGSLWFRAGETAPRCWELIVTVSGSSECDAYDCAIRVRLRFHRGSWPCEPPVVRILSLVSHWLVNDDATMMHPFYALLRQRCGGEGQPCTLGATMAVLHEILAQPRCALESSAIPLWAPVTLPFANGASRYSGEVNHPAMGGSQPQPFAVSIQKQDGAECFEGMWEALGHTGIARVNLDAASLEVMMYFETPLGEVLLDGVAHTKSGVLRGSCELQGVNGSFELNPVDFEDQVTMAEQRNRRRRKTIEAYTKLAKCPALFPARFGWREDWLSPDFVRAHRTGTREAWYASMVEHVPGHVFSFDLFTDTFCDVLVEEFLNFSASGLPARRPNSMNNYGVILSEMGLEKFADCLQELVQPLGELLWPGPGTAWDEYHCFTVRYRVGEDLGLDMHHDDSDVTFNVCLGREFEGAGLQFCGMVGAPDHRKQRFTYRHVKGRCVVHLGRHRHGADDITSGERLNLILWNRSSEYRKSLAFRKPPVAREEGPPDLPCLSVTHDRDVGVFREYPPEKAHLKQSAWCPPPDAEYRGFKR